MFPTNYTMFEKKIEKLFELKSSCMNFQNMSFTIVFLTGTILAKGALEGFFSSVCSNVHHQTVATLHSLRAIRAHVIVGTNFDGFILQETGEKPFFEKKCANKN